MTEKLTDEESAWLKSDPEFQKWDVRRKVLRIIDAHEAARAALVKELEEARVALKEESDIADFHAAAATRLEAEVARLTRRLGNG